MQDLLKIQTRDGLYANIDVSEIVSINDAIGTPMQDGTNVADGSRIVTSSGMHILCSYSASDIVDYLVAEELVTVHEFTPQQNP